MLDMPADCLQVEQGQDLAALDQAVRRWQSNARTARGALIGVNLPYAPPKFRWETAAGRLAEQHIGAGGLRK